MECGERKGRVRGYGSYISLRDVVGPSQSLKPTNDSKFKRMEEELKQLKEGQNSMSLALLIVARQNGTILPENLGELTPNWTPPSYGSHHSPMECEVEGALQVPQQHKETTFSGDVTRPKLVCIVHSYLLFLLNNFFTCMFMSYTIL